MTRQALAELSALLAQRAVLAPPSQVAKDALRLARYARAATNNAHDLRYKPDFTDAFYTKNKRVCEGCRPILAAYGLRVQTGASLHGPHFTLRALPNTPPIQGCPEGYAI